MHFVSSRGLGRGEIYIDLVNQLCQDVEVILLIPKGALYKNRINKEIEVIEYSMYNSRNNPLLLGELLWKIKVANPDIVHTHFVKASQIFNSINKLLHLPHVATKHNPRKGKIFNSLPHVIAVSKGVRESIDNENVHIIYNGVQPVEVDPQRKNEIFTLLAVGRLDKVKGFGILIEECAKLDFPFLLQIVGDGDEKNNLENLIKKCKLKDKVKLLGFRKDIPQLMKNSDVGVMSSHSEGFSLVMVESLFYANILLSTKVSGAIEILDDMFLFDGFNISEHLTKIYDDYSYYKINFDLLTKKIKNNFLIENIAKEHMKIYENILEGYE